MTTAISLRKTKNQRVEFHPVRLARPNDQDRTLPAFPVMRAYSVGCAPGRTRLSLPDEKSRNVLTAGRRRDGDAIMELTTMNFRNIMLAAAAVMRLSRFRRNPSAALRHRSRANIMQNETVQSRNGTATPGRSFRVRCRRDSAGKRRLGLRKRVRRSLNSITGITPLPRSTCQAEAHHFPGKSKNSARW